MRAKKKKMLLYRADETNIRARLSWAHKKVFVFIRKKTPGGRSATWLSQNFFPTRILYGMEQVVKILFEWNGGGTNTRVLLYLK